MQHVHTYSLEEMPVGFDGLVQLPVICEACFNAAHPEQRGRTCRTSHAALSRSNYHYQVVDWKGLGNTSCHCCGSSRYSGRFEVELIRRTRQ
jgi:hypothetical protein